MGFTTQMIWAGIIMSAVLVIFTLGKSPVFRVDRAGAAIIGSVAMIGAGVLTFEEAGQAVEFRTIIILFSMMVVVATTFNLPVEVEAGGADWHPAAAASRTTTGVLIFKMNTSTKAAAMTIFA